MAYQDQLWRMASVSYPFLSNSSFQLNHSILVPDWAYYLLATGDAWLALTGVIFFMALHYFALKIFRCVSVKRRFKSHHQHRAGEPRLNNSGRRTVGGRVYVARWLGSELFHFVDQWYLIFHYLHTLPLSRLIVEMRLSGYWFFILRYKVLINWLKSHVSMPTEILFEED